MSAIDQKALAEQMDAFATRIDPPLERWCYCHSRMSFKERRADDQLRTFIRTNGIAAVKRVVGLPDMSHSSILMRLRAINRRGLEGAVEWYAGFPTNVGLGCGPLQRWNIGHVYFLRVASLPHVMKIGFSRRVVDRIEDIRKSVGERLIISSLHVGTHIDEAWWHHNWRRTNIDGEWFFDPFKAERELPDFLATRAEAA